MQNNVVYLDDFRPMRILEDYAPQFGGPLPESFGPNENDFCPSPTNRFGSFLGAVFDIIAFIILIGICGLLWVVLP